MVRLSILSSCRETEEDGKTVVSGRGGRECGMNSGGGGWQEEVRLGEVEGMEQSRAGRGGCHTCAEQPCPKCYPKLCFR